MGSDVYDDISLEDSLSLPEKDYLHAAHVMLYAKWPGALFDKYPFKYAVMMQARFDGTLGFPGGMVDEGESPEAAVTRELAEEVGGSVSIQKSDHVTTCHSKKTNLCLHFYAKELPMEQFKEIERGVPRAHDWGSEVLGVIRCPLYTLPNGLGFPGFLRHNFIGSSYYQLLTAIERRGLLTAEEVRMAVERSRTVNPVVRRSDIDY